jgi:hypothetical protein
MDELARRNRCGVADYGDEITPSRLHLQDAETAVRIAEGHAFDRPDERFLVLCFWRVGHPSKTSCAPLGLFRNSRQLNRQPEIDLRQTATKKSRYSLVVIRSFEWRA